MKGSSKTFPIPEYQAPSTLSQAAPVQNTWYTILDTKKNVRLKSISVKVATTGEDIEVKITVDGQTLTDSESAVADTVYYCNLSGNVNVAAGSELYIVTTDGISARGFLLEGRSVKVEVRKTTAAGAGTITGKVIWGQH